MRTWSDGPGGERDVSMDRQCQTDRSHDLCCGACASRSSGQMDPSPRCASEYQPFAQQMRHRQTTLLKFYYLLQFLIIFLLPGA
jgi:hypothetical protein